MLFNGILACSAVAFFVVSIVVFYLKIFLICIACGSASVFSSIVLLLRVTRRRSAVDNLVVFDNVVIEAEPQNIHHI